MLTVVTGGAGFLGSHLVDSLIARGDDVIIVDNLSSGSLRNNDDALRRGRATFVYLDVAQPLSEIRGPIQKAAALRPIRQIFHLASPAGGKAQGSRAWETLSVGTMALIDLALEHRSRFIYASASEVYGDPFMHPQPESYFGNVDPIGPRAFYDEAKRFGEAAISVAAARRGLDARIVRFFNCYGPRMSSSDGRLIGALIEAVLGGVPLPIHGDGRQTCSITFVDDAIRLLLMVSSAPQSELAPVNVGSDDEHTVLEIAETFARVAGVPILVKYVGRRTPEPRRLQPDLGRARSMGYMPRTTLDDGFAKTIAWLRDGAGASV